MIGNSPKTRTKFPLASVTRPVKGFGSVLTSLDSTVSAYKDIVAPKSTYAFSLIGTFK